MNLMKSLAMFSKYVAATDWQVLINLMSHQHGTSMIKLDQ